MLDGYRRFILKYDLAILLVLVFGILAITVVTTNELPMPVQTAENLRR